MFYVYFIKSKINNKIYTGFTSKHPKDRLKEHNSGANEWTKNNKPFELIYFEEYECEKDAKKREAFYKTGFGRKIRNLILKELTNN